MCVNPSPREEMDKRLEERPSTASSHLVCAFVVIFFSSLQIASDSLFSSLEQAISFLGNHAN